jgi:hypothetical protein
MHFSRAIVSGAGSTQHVAHSAGRFNGSYAAIQAIACKFYYRRRLLMGVLLKRKTQLIFVTASSVEQNGKVRKVMVESRPLYAIVQLNGSKEKYPVAWEMIYKLAKDRHAENLRLETQSQSKRARIPRKKILK